MLDTVLFIYILFFPHRWPLMDLHAAWWTNQYSVLSNSLLPKRSVLIATVALSGQTFWCSKLVSIKKIIFAQNGSLSGQIILSIDPMGLDITEC